MVKELHLQGLHYVLLEAVEVLGFMSTYDGNIVQHTEELVVHIKELLLVREVSKLYQEGSSMMW